MPESNPRIAYRLGSSEAPLQPLEGKALICHVVLNVEHWPFDQPMPRKMLNAPHGRDPWPDVPNFSWVEYGLRQGLPRIARLLAERRLAASVAINASVLDVYPACAELALRSGWEFIGHGYEQRSLHWEQDEAEVIGRSVSRLEKYTGSRVRGWLGPGIAQTAHTPERLKRAGIDHCYDWMVDDVPCWMYTAEGPLLAVPYSLETNDVPIFAIEKHASPVFLDRIRDSVDMLARELATHPRVLTLALHPHIIGVPHRLKYLEQALDLLQQRHDTVFVRGSQICDWFTAQHPAPGR